MIVGGPVHGAALGGVEQPDLAFTNPNAAAGVDPVSSANQAAAFARISFSSRRIRFSLRNLRQSGPLLRLQTGYGGPGWVVRSMPVDLALPRWWSTGPSPPLRSTPTIRPRPVGSGKPSSVKTNGQAGPDRGW